jgi:glycosyltransferase involved in cell wall biosynthesis
MPRLLILCEYPTLLGGERSMLATLRAVAAAGFDVHVAAPPGRPLADALREAGVSHVRWSTHDDEHERLPLDRIRAGLANLFDQVRPDLVHANSVSTARISGPVAAGAGLPSVGHLRDIVRLSRQAIDDLNRHRRLIAVSRAARDFHVAQGIDATGCVVVYNGVDLDAFCPRAPTGYLHREFGVPPAVRLVATIGQLGLRKGTDVALAAALQAAGAVPDVHWLIVGERTSNKAESREFEALLRSIASEPPLAGRVHFLGSRSDVPLLMNECVLLVHAARQEPLGRALVEAAASGLPVVATDVGGTREIFPTESDGAVLVPPDNRFALAEAMAQLLNDEGRRQSLGAAARRRAAAAFNICETADRIIAQYNDLQRGCINTPAPSGRGPG